MRVPPARMRKEARIADELKAIISFQRKCTEWSDDKASRLAAALAYYTIFSLAPLLLIISITGFVVGESQVEGGCITRSKTRSGRKGPGRFRRWSRMCSASGSARWQP